MVETKEKLTTWKDDEKDYTLWEIKFLAQSHVCKVDAVLEKGASFPKKGKDESDPSLLDSNNGIKKAKIKIKYKKDMTMAYIMISFENKSS